MIVVARVGAQVGYQDSSEQVVSRKEMIVSRADRGGT